MAKVKIQGHASGTGVLTVTAPNTSSDRTITLPDSTGTILDENSSLPAANLTGTVADARISTLTASKLTGALPAISGASLTGITSNIKNGMTDFDLSSASGTNISVSGLGFTPTHILLQIVMSTSTQMVVMSMMGNVARSIVTGPAETAGTYTWNNNPQLLTGSGIYNLLNMNSLDADGFTLGNTKSAGSPTGTAKIQWMAFG